MKSSITPVIFSLLFLGVGCLQTPPDIASFEACVAAGNPVMESYPRQCRAGGTTFVEDVERPPEPPMEAPLEAQAGSVSLKKGETATLEGGFKLTLADIQDSRCPKDVQCVWAGELAALVTVDLAGSGETPVTLRLGLATEPKGAAFRRSFTLVSITEASATLSVAKL